MFKNYLADEREVFVYGFYPVTGRWCTEILESFSRLEWCKWGEINV